MKTICFTPSKSLSSAQDTEEKLELLNEQLEVLRQDLEQLLRDLESRISNLEK